MANAVKTGLGFGVLLGVLDTFKNVLGENQQVVDLMNQAMVVMQGVVNGVIEVLKPLFVWMGKAFKDPQKWWNDLVQSFKDGAAWIKENMIDQWVTQARSQQPGFVGPSFATIAAFNANGAMAHYRATESNAALIEGDGLLLIDSGGQYLGGTTDITRMVPVGVLSEAQRIDCTAVLQGMIALSRLHFPSGTPAPLVDAVARAPLWQLGLDYGHGTGHGVGYFLNVHEGPQVLSYRAPPSADMALLEGMVTSNEPGLYRTGQWGVRIENLVCCQAVASTDFGDFLAFETLTLCPIDTRCFVIEQLRPDERQWLNDYHRVVRERLSPGLSPTALRWLFTRTESLPL
jgi:Xaa-Pro aminopeptidase